MSGADRLLGAARKYGRPVESRTRAWRLFPKYAAFITALVGSAVLMSAGVGLYFSWLETRSNIQALQEEKARSAALRIQQFVLDIEHQIGWTEFTHAGFAGDAVEARRFDYYKLLRQVPAITDVTWIGADGRERLRISRLAMDRAGSGTDHSDDPAFMGALKGTTYFGPVLFRMGTEPYMRIARRAGNDGGVTMADVNLKFVWDVVSRIRVGISGIAYAVDAGGNLIAHPDISLVLKRTEMGALPQVAAALERVSEPLARDARDLNGRVLLAASAAIPSLDWFVFVETPREEALAPVLQTLERMAAVLAVGLLASIVASFFLARALVRPIRSLQHGALRIGAGELDHRIEVHTGDELEALGQQFNQMGGALKASYDELGRKVEERTAELRIALQEIQDKTRELESANQHKSEFLANMSHELRTPLNAVIGFSELLSAQVFGSLNAKQLEYLRDIHASGQHLLTLINDVLDLSKIEAGRMELDLSALDLPQLVAESSVLVRERAMRQGIRLTLDTPPESDAWTGDARKLKQCVVNLLSNAVKFTPAGGQVTVRTRRTESAGVSWAEITVSDTGVGIAPQHQALVFEEFRQVGPDVLRKDEGTGLGLALVKRFVELHGGQVSLCSVPGQGSTFSMRLPRRPPQEIA